MRPIENRLRRLETARRPASVPSMVCILPTGEVETVVRGDNRRMIQVAAYSATTVDALRLIVSGQFMA
jgi:hypothetical protein